MKMSFIVAASLLAFATTANAIPKKPEKCPGDFAIRHISLTKEDVRKPVGYDYWFVDKQDRFDTKHNWNFLFAQVYADNQTDAYKKVKSVLKSAALVQGPFLSVQGNAWVCNYSTNGYNIMTMTPVA